MRHTTRVMPNQRPVTAVLGPTNTGKTHYAVERMLAHGGGMIGLPLRLLAREVYDRVRAKTGDHAVALITGEERIVPANPRYWVATVEAMPSDVNVPFLAIDEVQIAQDFERGHIFTDRIMHRRGFEETLLLGSGTMRGILERLIPGITFIQRPRLSKLTYAGQKKLTRLPPRSAIVAFTAEMVYAVAELVRRQRGGAAVVMGALSPKTRNAQVALYQSGDVDFLVATDAIGMGLNMDVNHVAFAATRKFDGFQFRNLNPSELGQIAGRAGRYMNDGTFGVSGDAEPFEQETIDRLENHHFDSVKTLQWRNRELDFRSLDQLRKSLGYLPKQEGLTRAQAAPDVLALEAINRDASVYNLVSSARDVERAWEACQIPDYRNISSGEHAYLVGRVITHLQTGRGHIPEDWFAKQLNYCDNGEGGIDALSTRISHVRTWTFIANRPNWLEAPAYWQARAREIEDRLSDVLHEQLTQRFIDRKSSVVLRRLSKKEGLMTSVEDDGAIHVEGEFVGRIQGLSFLPDASIVAGEGRMMKAAAQQALATELSARAKALAMTADTELKLSREGRVTWQGHAVGKLEAGDTRFRPRVEALADDALPVAERDEVQARLAKFVERHIASLLEPLMKLEAADGLEGMARGIAFQLSEHYGVLPREKVATEVKGLSQEDRAKLRVHGMRFGAVTLFLPALLKPAATDLRLLLWHLEQKKSEIAAAPANGLTSVAADASATPGFYDVCGYRVCGNRAVRVDMLERLSDLIRDRVFWKPRIPEEQRPAGSIEGGGFTVISDMMSLVGCSGEEFEKILESLGFRSQKKSIPKPQPVVKTVAAPEAVVELVAETKAEEVPAVAEEAAASVEVAVDVVEEAPAAPEEVAVTVSEETVISETVPAADVEMIEVTVWWPKDTGPFRHQHKRPERHERKPRTEGDAAANKGRRDFRKPDGTKSEGDVEGHKVGKPHHRGGKRDDRRDDRGKRGDKPSGRPERAPRPERQPDPLSPFAALLALKEQMKGPTS
jgi:ATP-dependent RNA helicase SUPV3L1/SUV3